MGEGQPKGLPEPGTVVVRAGEPMFVGGGQGSARAPHDIIIPHDSLLHQAAQTPPMSSAELAFLRQPPKGGGVTGFVDSQ